MVVQCIAFGCTNIQDGTKPISFHSFPFKRPAILEAWVRAIGKHPSRSSKLCSEHFLQSDYRNFAVSNVKFLKPDAIPSVFSVSNSASKSIERELGEKIPDSCAVSSCRDQISTAQRQPNPKQFMRNIEQENTVTTDRTLLPILKNSQNRIDTSDSVSNGSCEKCVRLCECELGKQFLAELEASNPNITVVHEDEEAMSETEDQQFNNSTTENNLLNIVTLSKNVIIEGGTSTSPPNSISIIFQKPLVPILVAPKKQEEAHEQSAISKTSSTLEFDHVSQCEVGSTIDLCDNPLELNEICICCLKDTNVSSLRRSFVGGVSALTLYEAILEIKMNEEVVPAMICSKCLRVLSRIDNVLKIWKHSYKVLLDAANSIKGLKTHAGKPESYNLKKTEIIRQVLKEASGITLDDDMFQFIGPQTQTETNTSQEIQVDPLSCNSEDNDLQMSQWKRFRGRVHRYKINNDQLQQKRIRRKTVAVTTSDEKPSEDETTYLDYCPFCCKRVQFFDRHLRSMHSVDWVLLRCLKCSFHHEMPKKLIEHCKSCGITPKKEPDVIISKESIPDLHWYDESESKIEVEAAQMIEDETWLNDISMCDVKLEEDDEKLLNSLFMKANKKSFVCYKCENFSSSEFEKAKEHIMNVHSHEKKCVLCKRKYMRFQAMIYHVITFHGKRKCCKICLASFNNDQEAEEHKKIEPHGTCQFCGRTFQKRTQLYKHWRTHKSTSKKEPFKCPECSREYATRQGVDKHMAVFHKNLRYPCDTCDRSYTTNRALRLHKQSVHQGIRNVPVYEIYICETCGVKLPNKSRYKVEVHKAQHVGHNFVCRRCYASFPTKDLHEQHMIELNHRLFECQVCGATFIVQDAFKYHVENHTNSQNRRQIYNHWKMRNSTLKKEVGPFKCPECPREYATRQGVAKHMAVFHKNLRYSCDTCDRRYTTNRALRLHKQAVHQGIRIAPPVFKTYICETCGLGFSTKSRYKIEVHKAQHVGHNFVCRRCYSSFPTKDLHEEHMNDLNHHLFECQMCGATFVGPDAFKFHVENHTKSQKTAAKVWKCRYCFKTYKNKEIFENHEKLHTTERRYKCSECNLVFVTLANLKKHRVLHYRPEVTTQRKRFQEKTDLMDIEEKF